MNTVMHLVTQNGQPYGSVRKCCEKCGLSVFSMNGPGGHGYVEWDSDYTKDNAESQDAVRCCDITSP